MTRQQPKQIEAGVTQLVAEWRQMLHDHQFIIEVAQDKKAWKAYGREYRRACRADGLGPGKWPWPDRWK